MYIIGRMNHPQLLWPLTVKQTLQCKCNAIKFIQYARLFYYKSLGEPGLLLLILQPALRIRVLGKAGQLKEHFKIALNCVIKKGC